MAVILHVAASRTVMGKFVIPRYLRVVGWIAALAMFSASIGMLVTWK
jgi:Mn2+/Fe2+ NRAMP family transporter